MSKNGRKQITIRKESPRQILTLALSIIVVATAVLATHWPALSAKALCYDDSQYLTENALVKNPGWDSASRFLHEVLSPSTVGGYYQPLTMISLMLDYAKGGRADNLCVFHQTSLLLHVLNTALVIILIYGLFGRVWAAAAAGLLFGLHPMTVETIAWVGERKTVLAAFFAFLSLNFYITYARRGGWKFYTLTVLMYVLALMSKPTSTPLPLLMLVLDYWPLCRLSKAAIAEKLPMFVIGGISGIITIISQAGTSGVQLPGQYPTMIIPLAVCYLFIFYISKIFYPVHLSSYYPFPASFSLSEPMILTAVICMIILIAATAVSMRRTRGLLAGLLFFFIGLLPTMQVIGFSNAIASDKYAYLPSIGLLIFIAYLLICLWDMTAWKRFMRLCRVGMAMVVLIAAQREITGTRNYIVCWQDTKSLCLHMVEMSPDAPVPHNSLGLFYYQNGDIDKARNEWLKTIELNPYYAEPLNNLGALYYKNGDVDKAVKEWSKAVELSPDYPDALNNLAWVLATDEDAKKRNGDKAIRLAQRACQLTGYRDAAKVDTLAAAFAETGKFDEAVTTAQKAIETATKAEQKELTDEINKRLAFYRQDKAYRQRQ